MQPQEQPVIRIGKSAEIKLGICGEPVETKV